MTQSSLSLMRDLNADRRGWMNKYHRLLGHEPRTSVDNYRRACCVLGCLDRNDRILEFIG